MKPCGTATSYTANAPNKNLSTKIGSDVLQLSGTLLEQYTLPKQICKQVKKNTMHKFQECWSELFSCTISLNILIKPVLSLFNHWKVKLKRNLPLNQFNT